MEHKDIRDILQKWGRSVRTRPDKNEELKNVLFTKLEKTVQSELPKRSVPWFSLATAGLAIGIFVLSFIANTTVTPTLGVPGMEKADQAPVIANQISPMPPILDYFRSETSVRDTREFLKTDYNATLRTRRVGETTERVESVVRLLGGRVDSGNSSKKYGSVSFAIPANNLEAFRTQIRGLVRQKFLLEFTSTHNLLPQKQSIEEQRSNIETTLNELQTRRAELVAAHNRKVASINSRRQEISFELQIIRTTVTSDPVVQAELKQRENALLSEDGTLALSLANENSYYQKQLNSLDAQIRSTRSGMDRVNSEDQNLMDSVATVNGTISIQWISVWEVLNLYLPAYWLPSLLALLAIVSYYFHRKRYRVNY